MTTATRSKKRHNIDPDVALARATLAGMASRNCGPEEMARAKADLERANLRYFLRKLNLDHKEVVRIVRQEMSKR